MVFVSQFFRFFVGVLFIISGLIKLNDPVGTQIKMEEYFEVLGLQFLIPLALIIAVAMCVFEVVLGVALLVKARVRLTLMSLLALIAFFTFLTFYSAYFNKVTDCGCFGDAIKLTPWQSFSKDVVLSIMLIWLWVFQKHIPSHSNKSMADTFVLASTLASLGLAMYSIRHLSIIDFRAYKVGVDLQKATTLPPGAKQSVFQSFITLQKVGSGELKKVSDKEYIDSKIWADTTWKYLERSEPILVEKGDEPPIKDFKISDVNNTDYTAEMFKGNKLVVIAVHASKTDKEGAKDVKILADQLSGSSIEVLALTASAYDDFEAFRHEVQWAFPYYFADEKVLKTIIRSAPGLMLLKNGVVIQKWHYNDVPKAEALKALL